MEILGPANFIICVLMFIVAIINIIFFCKMWGMTNDVKEILKIMRQNQPQTEKPKPAAKHEQTTETDDIRLWRRNNMKVKVVGIGKSGLLCKALDGSGFMDYIPESELETEENK